MTELHVEQIRNFRLHSHHLDAEDQQTGPAELVGACGMQNTPPGAWETALYNRAGRLTLREMERMLYEERSLLQAWSFRGTPVVFPAAESEVFLSALMAEDGEPWIYTAGIGLALDFLQMPFDDLFILLKQVMPHLDGTSIESKTSLDQTLADRMLPLLPSDKQALWNQPSMYGSPDKQTVGGAVVSFLLRPCAFSGLVVFGERNGTSPSFTSFKNWTGRALTPGDKAAKTLVRKFLHCYGPGTVDGFVSWLGCSGKQGRRLWSVVSDEIEPVEAMGKKAWILSDDRKRLFSPAPLRRELILLGGHDPYLDQRDRTVLQQDRSLHRQIWKTVANPGAVLYRGEIVGIWTGKKQRTGMEIKISLWSDLRRQQLMQLRELAEQYAAFRDLKLLRVEL